MASFGPTSWATARETRLVASTSNCHSQGEIS